MIAKLARTEWNLGQITAVDEPISSADRLSTQRYEWRPYPQHRAAFPQGFHLPMWCTQRGARQIFAPCADSFEFSVLAFAGGISLLEQRGRVPPPSELDARGMLAMFQRAWHVREFQARRFKTVKDLRLKLAGSDPYGILPEDVGLDAQGRGQRWTIAELLEVGRTAASERGIARATTVQKIRLGFLAAAERNPLELTSKETIPIMRMALFSAKPSPDSAAPPLAQEVQSQIRAAIADHLDVSRRAKCARGRWVKSSHFELGIWPMGLLAVLPRKEAQCGEFTQNDRCTIDTVAPCARLVPPADRRGAVDQPANCGPLRSAAPSGRFKVHQRAD